VSRTVKTLVALATAVSLAGAAGPAFADDPPPTPACYAADGTPIFDPVVCEDLGRQASGH
jgi:hypothetical protein